MFITQKCDKSSIWYRDSNPRPLEHESRPITTRPGLPSLMKECLHSDSVTHVVPLINVITCDCKEVVHVTMRPSRSRFRQHETWVKIMRNVSVRQIFGVELVSVVSPCKVCAVTRWIGEGPVTNISIIDF